MKSSLCKIMRHHRAQLVSARAHRQIRLARGTLCKIASGGRSAPPSIPLALALPLRVAVLRMVSPIRAPVVAMGLGPGALRTSLVGAVVGILASRGVPLPTPFPLTRRRRAEPLLRHLGARREQPATADTSTQSHGRLSKRNHPSRLRQAKSRAALPAAGWRRLPFGQIRGSFPMSKRGSTRVSAKALSRRCAPT